MTVNVTLAHRLRGSKLDLLALACSTVRETSPPRTASEQLLISSAADRAAERVAQAMPQGKTVYVDGQYFEGTDAKYAVGAVREYLLKNGIRLMSDRAAADVVVELRAGALSIDEKSLIVGIPQTDIPIPLAGTFTLPELALFNKKTRMGVAKLAGSGYDADSVGHLPMRPDRS